VGILKNHSIEHVTIQGGTQGWGWLLGCSPLPKSKFKKHRLSKHDDVTGFTQFTLQPKSATEIS
jgi:hypothetical protein